MKVLKEGVLIKSSGGLNDIFDNMIKQLFNITDNEYDFICENATDEDLNTFLSGFGGLDDEPTFTEKRKALEMRNKYLEKFNNK
jgi:hypothetical protein